MDISFAHILLLLLLGVVTLFPIQQILHRTGHSRWWCLITLPPNWLGIWVLAFIRWPGVDKAGVNQ